MVDHRFPVWSTAWFTAAARLVAVGVTTGALTAAVLVLLVTAMEGGTPLDVAGFLLFAAVIGAACGLPVALVCASTGLVAAACTPQRRTVAIGLILLWPTAATVAVGAFVISYTDYGFWASTFLLSAACGLVAACVFSTYRWVSAPLHSTPPSERSTSHPPAAR